MRVDRTQRPGESWPVASAPDGATLDRLGASPKALVEALGRADPGMRARAVSQIQRQAGNAAVGRLLRASRPAGRTLARFVAPYTAPFIATQLQDAMEGVGTDEEQIFAALSGVSRAELPQVEAEYRSLTGNSLRADLLDELSESDFKRIAVYRPIGPDSIAEQLRDAMEGLGTDENAIYAALSGRSRAEVDQIAAAYLRLTRRSLQKDLESELTQSELMRLGALAPDAAATSQSMADQIAAQLRDAIEGPGTNEEAIFAALNGRGPAEISEIKAAYQRLTRRSLEAALRDDLSGDELDQALGTLGIAPSVKETSTELGRLSVGNFDFEFSGGQITVTVRVKFQFTDDITAPEQAVFKPRFLNAVHAKWRNTGYSLKGEGNCPCQNVPIEIRVQENASDPHKLVDVEKQSDSDRRPKIIADINVNLGTDDATLGHEFGHVIGLYDEYDGGFFENIMFWHVNRTEDPNALMSGGAELRPRYFEHFRERVERTAAPGCVYQIVAPP